MGGHNLYNVLSSIGTGSLLSDPGPGDPGGTDPVTRSFTVHGPWRYVIRRQATLGPAIAEGPGVRTERYFSLLFTMKATRSLAGAGIANRPLVFLEIFF